MKKAAQISTVFGLTAMSTGLFAAYVWMAGQNTFDTYVTERQIVKTSLSLPSLQAAADRKAGQAFDTRPFLDPIDKRTLTVLSHPGSFKSLAVIAYEAALANAVRPKGPRPVGPDGKQALYPELVPICACESSYWGAWWDKPRQFENGKVLRNYEGSRDVGMCQISEDVHGETARSLGYDIYTPEGNISYANWLFEQEGSAPWYESEKCWRKAKIFQAATVN